MSLEKNRVYSADDYLAALANHKINHRVSFEGIVANAADDASLMYAHPLSCDRWVVIPRSQIETITHLGTRPCGGHQHPFVRITLVRAETAHERSLLALASLHHDVATNLRAQIGATGSVCPNGWCFNSESQQWECC